MKKFIPEKFRILDTNKPLYVLGESSGGVLFLPENECFIAELPNSRKEMRKVLIIAVNIGTVYKTSNFCTYDVFIRNIIFKQMTPQGKVLDNKIFFIRTPDYSDYYPRGTKRPYKDPSPCFECFPVTHTLSNKTMVAVWLDAFKERIAYRAAKSFGESLYYRNHSFSDDAISRLYNNPYWKLHYEQIQAQCITAEYESSKYHKAYKYAGPLEIDATPDSPMTQEERDIARSYCAIMSGVNVLRLKDIESIDPSKLTREHIREHYIITRLQQYQSEVGIDYLGRVEPCGSW